MKKVLILVVLYEELLSDAVSAQVLLQCINDKELDEKNILFFDNSESYTIRNKNQSIAKRLKLQYMTVNSNVGLAEAYEYARLRAEKFGYSYLMLLDQDTAVTESFFKDVQTAIESKVSDEVVAIIPRIVEDNQIFEPVKLNPLYSKKVVTPGVHQEIVSINSGTVIKVNFLKKIGGFNKDFPIDYLDHWVFYMIAKCNKSVFVMTSTITQRLSVHSLREVSVERYQSIISSEHRYITNYRREEIIRYYCHVFLRIGKLIVSGNFDKAILNVKNIVGSLK